MDALPLLCTYKGKQQKWRWHVAGILMGSRERESERVGDVKKERALGGCFMTQLTLSRNEIDPDIAPRRFRNRAWHRFATQSSQSDKRGTRISGICSLRWQAVTGSE